MRSLPSQHLNLVLLLKLPKETANPKTLSQSPSQNPSKPGMKQYDHKKLHRMEKLRAPLPGLVQNLNNKIAHRLPPRIEPRAFKPLPMIHTLYDGVITSSISSCGTNIQSRVNDAHRPKNCYLYNHPCSQWKGLAPDPPYYNRSHAEIEVVKINRSWHLVCTKCRVEKDDNSGIEHSHEHRHWAEPSREAPPPLLQQLQVSRGEESQRS